jgi:hypothetical protein
MSTYFDLFIAQMVGGLYLHRTYHNTVFISFMFLSLENYGVRKLEGLFAVLITTMACSFAWMFVETEPSGKDLFIGGYLFLLNLLFPFKYVKDLTIKGEMVRLRFKPMVVVGMQQVTLLHSHLMSYYLQLTTL